MDILEKEKLDVISQCQSYEKHEALASKHMLICLVKEGLSVPSLLKSATASEKDVHVLYRAILMIYILSEKKGEATSL